VGRIGAWRLPRWRCMSAWPASRCASSEKHRRPPAMGLLSRDDKSVKRRGRGFRTGGFWAFFLFCSFLTATGPAHGQSLGNRIIYSRQPVFRIPFETDAGERRLQEVQLYVSEDRGQTWKPAGTVPPEQRNFNFRA